MFESAELGHHTDQETFDAAVPALRAELLDAQFDLLELKQFAVVVLINGVDKAGKGETINLLNEWMDPRHIETWAFDAPTPEESERPFMWRFWRALPPRGKIGVMFNNWYTQPIRDRVDKRSARAELDQRLDEIRRFEAMLVHEGVLLVKFWFHLPKDAQKKRLKALEKDARTRWRVTERDWKYYEQYDRYREVAGHVLRTTSTGDAPWLIVDGSDARFRALFVARTLLAALRRRLDAASQHWMPRLSAAPLPPCIDRLNVLDSLVHTRMKRKEYDELLERLQGRLALLSRSELRQGDYRAAVADAEKGDFVYFDPPYDPVTPTANFTSYSADGFGPDDQRTLAETARELVARGCKVMLSNSDTPFIRSIYKGFKIATVKCPRAINSNADASSCSRR